MFDYAPVVLFLYNRPAHTERVLKALRCNILASKTDLIVFSDGARGGDEKNVSDVRALLHDIDGFKSVELIERQKNYGLAASIIDGVTQVIERYGKVIVLEDDIVTAPYFLSFMNQALDHYQYNDRIWHISGWNYPIDQDGLGDAFLWRVMNCWGWATWANRWRQFSKEPTRLVLEWGRDKKKRFDLDGSGVFWSQVEANLKGTMNTWAIFWYATIFERDGLCLNPSVSYVENIGHDGTGEHCGSDDNLMIQNLNTSGAVGLPTKLVESSLAVSRVQSFYATQRAGKVRRFWRKCLQVLG